MEGALVGERSTQNVVWCVTHVLWQCLETVHTLGESLHDVFMLDVLIGFIYVRRA